jgi:hypothetical protein
MFLFGGGLVESDPLGVSRMSTGVGSVFEVSFGSRKSSFDAKGEKPEQV